MTGVKEPADTASGRTLMIPVHALQAPLQEVPEDCLVTVFGFTEGNAAEVMYEMAQCGEIMWQGSDHTGNWMHLQFAVGCRSTREVSLCILLQWCFCSRLQRTSMLAVSLIYVQLPCPTIQ